jgi:S-DNA-T family DNA segregation ATPase FtsK/SpoIIIE
VLLLNGDGFYKVGRASTCELALRDPDLSREHVKIYRKGTRVTVRDLSSKNGAFLGNELVGSGRSAEWPPKTMLRLAGTVLALEDPLAELIAELARAPDLPIGQDDVPTVVESEPPPPSPKPEAVEVSEGPSAAMAPIAEMPLAPAAVLAPKTAADRLLFVLLAVVLVVCVGGLAWIFLRW